MAAVSPWLLTALFAPSGEIWPALLFRRHSNRQATGDRQTVLERRDAQVATTLKLQDGKLSSTLTNTEFPPAAANVRIADDPGAGRFGQCRCFLTMSSSEEGRGGPSAFRQGAGFLCPSQLCEQNAAEHDQLAIAGELPGIV